MFVLSRPPAIPPVGEHAEFQAGLAEAHESVEQDRIGDGHRYAYYVCEKMAKV